MNHIWVTVWLMFNTDDIAVVYVLSSLNIIGHHGESGGQIKIRKRTKVGNGLYGWSTTGVLNVFGWGPTEKLWPCLATP